MHKEHKTLEISDVEALGKENISIESSAKDFNECPKDYRFKR